MWLAIPLLLAAYVAGGIQAAKEAAPRSQVAAGKAALLVGRRRRGLPGPGRRHRVLILRDDPEIHPEGTTRYRAVPSVDRRRPRGCSGLADRKNSS